MSGLVWHPRLSCGIDAIDIMHQDILTTMGTLAQAADVDDPAFAGVLHRLHRQVIEHFEAEERLLSRHLDPLQVQTHAEDHANLLKLLADADGVVHGRDGGATSKVALVRLLRNWLLKEIADNDGHAFMLASGVVGSR